MTWRCALRFCETIIQWWFGNFNFIIQSIMTLIVAGRTIEGDLSTQTDSAFVPKWLAPSPAVRLSWLTFWFWHKVHRSAFWSSSEARPSLPSGWVWAGRSGQKTSRCVRWYLSPAAQRQNSKRQINNKTKKIYIYLRQEGYKKWF